MAADLARSRAIGLTTVVSVLGGFIGIAALAVGAPLLSNLALLFAPRDYLMLAIWGLLLVGSLSGESLAKGLYAGALGVLIGMIGLDPMTAEGRFTYGIVELTGGIPYVAAMIGIILGPLIDVSYRRAIISAGDAPLPFLAGFFTSPVSIVLVAALALTVLSQTSP